MSAMKANWTMHIRPRASAGAAARLSKACVSLESCASILLQLLCRRREHFASASGSSGLTSELRDTVFHSGSIYDEVVRHSCSAANDARRGLEVSGPAAAFSPALSMAEDGVMPTSSASQHGIRGAVG